MLKRVGIYTVQRFLNGNVGVRLTSSRAEWNNHKVIPEAGLLLRDFEAGRAVANTDLVPYSRHLDLSEEEVAGLLCMVVAMRETTRDAASEARALLGHDERVGRALHLRRSSAVIRRVSELSGVSDHALRALLGERWPETALRLGGQRLSFRGEMLLLGEEEATAERLLRAIAEPEPEPQPEPQQEAA